jgi:acid phosphatase family membrane protein YuiD
MYAGAVKSAAVVLLLQLATVNAAAQSDGVKWWQPVLVVGAIATASLADRSVNDWIQDHRTPQSDDVANVFRYGGEPVVALGIPGAIVLAGTIAGRDDVQRSGGRVLLSVVAAEVTTIALKATAGRYRPAETDDPYIFKPFSGHDSFPSGHTTMAFALATSLSHEIHNGWASAALFTVATGTAWSRLNDERHWFSDVLGGAAVGITAATIVNRHPPRFLAEPNGRGVRLEWRVAF